jgi:hypothetical protein
MNPFQDAVEALFTERINIELLITSDEEGYVFFNFRARPWKNSPNDGRMLLVGASHLEEAFVLLADALERQSWVPLDWKTRLHAPAYAPAPAERPSPRFRPNEVEKPSEDGLLPFPYTRA